MGTYLSTPILEKDVEEGIDLESSSTPVSWAVVDMQGWRKTMEDSHLAQTNVPTTRNVTRDNVAQVFGVFDGHGGAEVARICSLYLVDVLKQQPEWENGNDVGRAFVNSFHALDRMVGDVKRREEISDLRQIKPEHSSMRTIAETFPIPPVALDDVTDVKEGETKADETLSNKFEKNASEACDDQAKKVDKIVQEKNGNTEENATKIEPTRKISDTIDVAGQEEEKKESLTTEKQQLCTGSDDDSDKAVLSTEEASDDDSLNELDDVNDNDGGVSSNSAAIQVIKRFLFEHTGDKGQAHIQLGSDNNNEGSKSRSQTQQNAKHENKESEKESTPSAKNPTRFVNGKKVCNLPEHPIHAGCTSICAVIINRVLTVANAGDSRAILCRAGGVTKALSFDHKPSHDIEMDRITKAGGFVNQFGRVNGNLNLSRAIGDLKYKQVPGIPLSEQMITAEPDIEQVTLKDDDEFIILACDGIWDCLSNEEAVKYVENRIHTKSPKEIGTEMLDEIISVDPKNTQGIGGDNMTVMIIDLQSCKRSYSINESSAAKGEKTATDQSEKVV